MNAQSRTTAPDARRRTPWLTPRRTALVSLALMLLAPSWVMRPRAVAGIVVDSTADVIGDNGACTLREAIINANTDSQSGSTDCAAGVGSADLITFSVTGTITLALTGAESAISGANATINDLDITDGLTINGPGVSSLTIQAGATTAAGIDRVFHVNPSRNATFAVQIDNLTVTHGKTGSRGGAIRFSGENTNDGSRAGFLTLDAVRLTDNQSTGLGGGIYGENGILTIQNGSEISNNVATDAGGGGIEFGSTSVSASTVVFQLTGSTVSGNKALDAVDDAFENGTGGGIEIIGEGKYIIQNSTISNNQAEHFGGGIRIGGVTAISNNVVITGNKAGGNGGGVFADLEPTIIGSGGNMTMDAVTIKQNTADASIDGQPTNNGSGNGGGIYFDRDTLTVTNSIVGGASGNGNTAVDGGGIYVNAGTLTINLSRISHDVDSAGPAVTGILNASGPSVNAERNWWGCDAAPGGAGCDNTSGTVDADPRIDLRLSASPSSININNTSSLTADVTKDSNGVTLSPAPTGLDGLNVTFASDALGSITPPATVALSSNSAAATYQAGSSGGNSTVSATLQNGTQNATITIINPTADLSIAISDSPDPVLTPNNIVFTVMVSNAGPGTAQDVVLTTALPASGVTFSSTNGCAEDGSGGGVPTCTLGSISPGGSKNFTITVAASVVADTTLTTTADVAGSTTDPNSADNHDEETTRALPATDNDDDGIPNVVDCAPVLVEDLVVDPNDTLAGIIADGRRYDALQDAVTAAADNDSIGVYADTTENVVIGSTMGSGGKDLRIIGCGATITADNAAQPVVTVEVSAGAADGDTGDGIKDIQIQNLTATGGSVGFAVATEGPPLSAAEIARPLDTTDEVAPPQPAPEPASASDEVSQAEPASQNAVLTSTLLRRVTASQNDVGIQVSGKGVTVGRSTASSNTSHGIEVTGTRNLIADSFSTSNGGNGVAVSGATNVVVRDEVGGAGVGNTLDGISVASNGNRVQANTVHGNGGSGVVASGNNNKLAGNVVGDTGKGNGGDGIRVVGRGNKILQNQVYANLGDGLDVSGGTSSSYNRIVKNVVGAGGKGNGGVGILVDGTGNGVSQLIEIQRNKARANGAGGIGVLGTGHQLQDNISGGSGAQDNTGCEFNVVAGNFNTGGDTANGVLVPGALNSPFPTGCIGTP